MSEYYKLFGELYGNIMEILITNDDGIQSPGLKKIHSLISRYSKNVIIVAPSDL